MIRKKTIMQSLLIGALTLSLSASVSSYAAEKEQNKAIIAKGTEDEYIVPPEATQIVESSLPTSIKKNIDRQSTRLNSSH